MNKWALYQWMCEHGYACAKSYIDLEAFYQVLEAGEVQYPVFVKPMKGSASLHIAKAEDKETVELLSSWRTDDDTGIHGRTGNRS